MEHIVAVPPSLQPIEENQVLSIDPDEAEQREYESSIESIDERTSLVRSGSHLSYSYTESMARFMDTNEQEQRTFDGTETEVGSRTDTPQQFQSSIMTDFQASYFLPSLLISSYSSVRQSYEHYARSMAQSIMKKSHYGSTSVAVSLIEKFSDDRGASFGLTMFNLLPMLCGAAIFTLPNAVAVGGYVTIPFFILISIMADFTSMILVDSMYEVSPKSKKLKRTKLDYVEIARAAFGKPGGRLINFILIFYLYAVNVVSLVLIGKSVYAILASFAPLSSKAVMAIFSITVIPTLFIQRLSHLAYLSFLSVLAITIGAISTIVAFVIESKSWHNNITAIPVFDWNGFALAISIWSYTIIPHTIIPQVESSMQEPKKYGKALHSSFATATAIKAIYGVLGALTYGVATESLILDNIKAFSFPLSVLANAVVSIFAILNFPLNLFVVCDAFDQITLGKKRMNWKKGGKYHPLWILMTRPVMVGLGLSIGLVVPYFGLLVGVLGSLLGTLLVFLFPCLFHLKLKWKKLGFGKKLLEIAVLVAGTAFGGVGLFASVKGLYLAISAESS